MMSLIIQLSPVYFETSHPLWKMILGELQGLGYCSVAEEFHYIHERLHFTFI